MTVDPQVALAAARRTYFPVFLMKVFETLHPSAPPLEMSWYIKAMCHVLTEVHKGNVTRQVITVPPRHLKSITSSVAFAAWSLGHDASTHIIVAYYGLELAREHHAMTRRVMESSWYQQDFPLTKIASAQGRDIRTTAGGGRKAVSVDSAATGFGADIIIVDDCMKANEATSQAACDNARSWFDNTLVSRVNNKATGKIISIQQRLSEGDLTAYLLEKNFAELRLPAIAEKDEFIAIGDDLFFQRKTGDLLSPDREDRAVLERARTEMGAVAFSAQYQQNPVVAEGNLIQMQWFGSYDEVPARHEFLKVIQSWDTGMSANPSCDYSVCTTWGFHRETYKWYLLDVFRQRLDFPDLKRAVIRLHQYWAADGVVIEDASSGKSLCQDLRVTRELVPVLMRPVGSKEERFTGCLAEVEAGHFLLPNDAPWIEAFRSEIRAFPRGAHDDQVDSFTQLVRFQLPRWRYLLTEYTRQGRCQAFVRIKKRPW